MAIIKFNIREEEFELDVDKIRRWTNQSEDYHAFHSLDGKVFFIKRFEHKPPALELLPKLVGKQLANIPNIYEFSFIEKDSCYYLIQDKIEDANTISQATTNNIAIIYIQQLLSQLYSAIKQLHNQGFWHTDICLSNILISVGKSLNYYLIDIDSCRDITENVENNAIDKSLSHLLSEYKKYSTEINGMQYNLLQLIYLPLPFIAFNILSSKGKANSINELLDNPDSVIQMIPSIIPDMESFYKKIFQNKFSEQDLRKYIFHLSSYLKDGQCIGTTNLDSFKTRESVPKILSFYKDLDIVLKKTATKFKPELKSKSIKSEVPPKAQIPKSLKLFINNKQSEEIFEGEEIRLTVEIKGLKGATLYKDDTDPQKISPDFSFVYQPQNSTVYKLENGKHESKAYLKVNKKPKPTIKTISVNDKIKNRVYFSEGDKFYVSWLLEEADGVEIEGELYGKSIYGKYFEAQISRTLKITPYASYNNSMIKGPEQLVEIVVRNLTSEKKIEPKLKNKKPTQSKKIKKTKRNIDESIAVESKSPEKEQPFEEKIDSKLPSKEQAQWPIYSAIGAALAGTGGIIIGNIFLLGISLIIGCISIYKLTNK